MSDAESLPRERLLGAFTLLLGYALFTLAWLLADPPGAAVDEEAHYVKAAGLSKGVLVGDWVEIDQGHAPTRRYLWVTQVSRGVRLPSSLAPPDFAGCYATKPTVSAKCSLAEQAASAPVEAVTYVATYPPFAYVLPAVLMAHAQNPWLALYLGRAGIAVESLLLFGLALVTLGHRRDSSLTWLGLLLATTPLVLYLDASLTPSAIEVSAALCFTAGLIRVRDSSGRTPLPELAIAIGGFALATARPLSGLWLLVLAASLVVVGPLAGRDYRSLLARIAAPSIFVFCGFIAGIGWALATGQQPAMDFEGAIMSVPAALLDLPRAVLEQVGWFGWVDTPLPGLAYAAWLGVVSAVLALGLLLGTWRERFQLFALTVATLATAVLLDAFLMVPIGQHLQGRHVMALTVAIPMWSGEVIYQHRRQLSLAAQRRCLSIVGTAVGCLQLLAWLVNARRYAVGMGGAILFTASPDAWQPPGTWSVGIGVALAASVALVAGVIASSRVPRARA